MTVVDGSRKRQYGVGWCSLQLSRRSHLFIVVHVPRGWAAWLWSVDSWQKPQPTATSDSKSSCRWSHFTALRSIRI